jgi:hypothetical protein
MVQRSMKLLVMPQRELSKNIEKFPLMLLKLKILSNQLTTLLMQKPWLKLIERDLNIKLAYGYQEMQFISKQKNQYQKLRKINLLRILVKPKEWPEMSNTNHPLLPLLPRKLLLMPIPLNGKKELVMMMILLKLLC